MDDLKRKIALRVMVVVLLLAVLGVLALSVVAGVETQWPTSAILAVVMASVAAVAAAVVVGLFLTKTVDANLEAVRESIAAKKTAVQRRLEQRERERQRAIVARLEAQRAGLTERVLFLNRTIDTLTQADEHDRQAVQALDTAAAQAKAAEEAVQDAIAAAPLPPSLVAPPVPPRPAFLAQPQTKTTTSAAADAAMERALRSDLSDSQRAFCERKQRAGERLPPTCY